MDAKDDFQAKIRYNDAQVDRVMGGADGGGLVVLRVNPKTA
ncbi:MAG: hypothetical protein CM15mP120_19660 [Pseudomonadota bacterium]|nr:MAG: hypothetical protein CM15mP120_19660 [Pseudomonadota bacterium]